MAKTVAIASWHPALRPELWYIVGIYENEEIAKEACYFYEVKHGSEGTKPFGEVWREESLLDCFRYSTDGYWAYYNIDIYEVKDEPTIE